MKHFTPSLSLRLHAENDVNRSIGCVGDVRYWHPTKFKHLCRDMHGNNYHLYCALGKYLLNQGLITENYGEYTPVDYARMLLAIIDFLPDDFIPYKSMGATTPAKDYKWISELQDCSENAREWIHSSQIKSLRYSNLKSPDPRKFSL